MYTDTRSYVKRILSKHSSLGEPETESRLDTNTKTDGRTRI